MFEVERGGDVTFHGPGQLVGYPILDLASTRHDLHWYLRQLEETLIAALAALGIGGGTAPGLTGVWTSGRKIASIGIHVKQWVTFHGFALNVTTDLRCFDLIVPCGIHGVAMTSVAGELGARDGDAAVDGDPDAVVDGVRAHVRMRPHRAGRCHRDSVHAAPDDARLMPDRIDVRPLGRGAFPPDR